MSNEVAGKTRPDAVTKFVTFHVADMKFGVDIHTVEEVIPMTEVTKVPNTPPFVEGVINVRGRIIPLLDLRRRFHLEPVPRTPAMRIIIVNLQEGYLGLSVDRVAKLQNVSEADVEPAPRYALGVDTRFLRGVGKTERELLLIIDVETLLSTEEKRLLPSSEEGEEGVTSLFDNKS